MNNHMLGINVLRRIHLSLCRRILTSHVVSNCVKRMHKQFEYAFHLGTLITFTVSHSVA